MLKLVVALVSLALLSEAVTIIPLKKTKNFGLSYVATTYSYYGTITIGTPPQEMSVTFDTNSFDLRVPTVGCSYLNNSKCYNPDNSLTCVDKNISIWKGHYVEDTVTIADLVIPKQVIFAITKNFYWDDPDKAVLGLGHEKSTKEGFAPVLQNMVNNRLIENSVFSFYFAEEGSALDLGGVDPNHYTGEITYVQALNNYRNWQIIIDKVYMGDEITCESERQAIVDTEYFSIAVPQWTLSNLLEPLGATFNRNLHDFLVDCSTIDSLPPLTLRIGGRDFTIEAKHFTRQRKEFCHVDIPTTYNNSWILGQAFIRKYYTVFNLDTDQVGFALAK